MQASLFQPFERMRFDTRQCFLSGEKLSSPSTFQVFAPWLVELYRLNERPFKLLDESITSYADIRIPASPACIRAFTSLESEIETAFKEGYPAVKNLSEISIFQWVAKTVYGVIYKEIETALKQQTAGGERFNLSQGLIHKFSMLHHMLQSVMFPVRFEDFKPWSIFICPVENAPDEFLYRDEINTLTFSLRMKDFGIIVCLQDNGANLKYHQEIWEKLKGKTLHPIQFEELCAKVFYSAYLFNRLPEYHLYALNGENYIEAMPLRGMSAKPVFDEWQNKTYGQVLENFWKRWNILLFEIIRNPEAPQSFLFNGKQEVIASSEISLEK